MNVENVTGQTLGHYTVLGTIGVGGMGQVNRAHDPRLNRDVAIKVLLQGTAAGILERSRSSRVAS